jgi:hypothetical protein
VLSDGLNVNGSELVNGLVDAIGPDIPLTGGLAGDGANFKETLVGGDCAPPRSRIVVGVGFYGSAIKIGHGSAGGWDLFGPAPAGDEVEGKRAVRTGRRARQYPQPKSDGCCIQIAAEQWPKTSPPSASCYAAPSWLRPARRYNIAANAPKIFRICGGL